MHRKRKSAAQKNEQGIIITLVAVFMLGVVGAMAALSIDVTTLYTARSEAQLAADAAALAGARVLANSGMTSSSTNTLGATAATWAIAVATQVAASSPVGGRDLKPGASPCKTGQEICVSIPTTGANFIPNPQVTVQVQRTDLPTFFARIWGTKQVAVAASATAEAYNPSYLAGKSTNSGPPIAPTCVKPWLLPNMDPTNGSNTIFDPASGAITSGATLLGWTATARLSRLGSNCTSCAATSTPKAWMYYPGTTDPTTGDYPAPSASSCSGCAAFSNNQLSVAGCVETPISCNKLVKVDQTSMPTLDSDTAAAVDALTHSTGNGGDKVDLNPAPPPNGTAPFQFLAGSENPLVVSGALPDQSDIMVSDSLVTVPVTDSTAAVPWPHTFPQVQIIGFVQLFLSPNGAPVPTNNYHMRTQVINLVGCGNGTGGVTGNAINGNGASAVAVRLISP
jgi:Flp pilus assembly protein TadG